MVKFEEKDIKCSKCGEEFHIIAVVGTIKEDELCPECHRKSKA